MRDYHVWKTIDNENAWPLDGITAEVRWYGGSQVNCYNEQGVEFEVWSLAEWWETTPTLAQVDAAVRARVNRMEY